MDGSWIAQNWPGIASVVAVLVAGAVGVKSLIMGSGRDSVAHSSDTRQGNISLHQGEGGSMISRDLGALCTGQASIEKVLDKLSDAMGRLATGQTQMVETLQQQTSLLQAAFHGQAVAELQREASDSHERLEAVHRERLRDSLPAISRRNSGGST